MGCFKERRDATHLINISTMNTSSMIMEIPFLLWQKKIRFWPFRFNITTGRKKKLQRVFCCIDALSVLMKFDGQRHKNLSGFNQIKEARRIWKRVKSLFCDVLRYMRVFMRRKHFSLAQLLSHPMYSGRIERIFCCSARARKPFNILFFIPGASGHAW